MGNMSSTGFDHDWDAGMGHWQFGDKDGNMVFMNVWDNGDISFCHKIVQGDDHIQKCPNTGRVPCAWSKDGQFWEVVGSGLICGFGKLDLRLKVGTTGYMQVEIFDMPGSPYSSDAEVKASFMMERNNSNFDMDIFHGMPGLT